MYLISVPLFLLTVVISRTVLRSISSHRANERNLQVEEGRPVCDPNSGFKEQLAVWGEMLKEKDDVKRQALYQEWAKNRFKGSSWEWEKRVESEKAKARL
jgi:hypothetical protein